jgi:hypothetical protein
MFRYAPKGAVEFRSNFIYKRIIICAFENLSSLRNHDA